MGKKLQESSEPEEPTVNDSTHHDKKSKKKKKNKHSEEEQPNHEVTELVSKRKHEEAESPEKKKKKKIKAVEEEKDGGVADEINARKERQDNVAVTGKDSGDPKYKPLASFADAKLPENVLSCCEGFKKPSPIQAHSWPFLLDGRDFIGIAKTGSGKTLAFGIPAIMHVLGKRKEKSGARRGNPLCLVLSPTRELADQCFFSNDSGHCHWNSKSFEGFDGDECM